LPDDNVAMSATVTNAAAARLANRILGDYPMAQQRLAAHAGARIAVNVGPAEFSLGVTPTGTLEPAGNSDAATDVTLTIPLAAVPALLNKSEGATQQIQFSGDSELAATLSTIARNVSWDIEEDVAQLLATAGLGKWADVIAHRAVGAATGAKEAVREVSTRFTENVAEYLVYERDAFATKDELIALQRDNDQLRDAVARLDARLKLLHLKASS
jgi:ubiquinone biosynthesis protein UbiJ